MKEENEQYLRMDMKEGRREGDREGGKMGEGRARNKSFNLEPYFF